MVDAEQVENRLERLEAMLERLEEIRSAGEEAYLAAKQRLATERLLQLSIQICIDLAAQVVSEQSAPPPSSYSDVFKILGDKGVLSAEIAERLGNAARQRNLLVHLYMEMMTGRCLPRWRSSTTFVSSPRLLDAWPRQTHATDSRPTLSSSATPCFRADIGAVPCG